METLPSEIQQDYLDQEEKEGKTVESNQICSQYIKYEKFHTLQYWLTTIIIIIFNGFFYTMTYPLIQKIGYHHL